MLYDQNGRYFGYNGRVKKILIYGLDETEADKTQAILERIGIAAYVIGDDVLDEKVNRVFETEEDFDGRHQEFPLSYMLFDGFDLNGVMSVLDLLHRNRQDFDGVKIMRTDTNSSWKMKDLLTHTAESYEVGKKTLILDEVIRSCSGLDLSEADGKVRAEFKKSLSEALKLLQSNAYNAEQIDRVTVNLVNAMKGARKLYN